MENTFAEWLRQSLKDAHQTLEETMQGVTDEVAHWQPPGKALPIAAAYVHTIVSEDMMLKGWMQKEKTLIDQGWDKKMGLNAPHPIMDQNWEKNYTEWTKTVKVDMKKFKEYAQTD